MNSGRVGAGRTGALLARPRVRVGLVVLLVAVALGFDAAFAQRHGFFDLNVYWGAINYWTSGQGELYDFIRPASTYGFTYPPFAAIAMLPMVLVSWPVAIVLASIATFAATGLVIWWLLAEGRGRAGWFPVAIALALLMAFEPLRETFLFGQVNMLLVALVGADLLFGLRRGRWWAGVGIGLATAIKLTPGVFIIYLLVTGRIKAAFVAMGSAAGATLLAAAIAPDAAREFFTSAIWDTDRIGRLSFVSNQSLQGLVARLDDAHPSKLLWLVLVLATLAVWIVRSRRAVAAGDEATGFALTGIVGCLISPVTWIHHLVWLIPAILLLVKRGAERRDWRLLGLAAAVYVLLSSRVVWLFDADYGLGWPVTGVAGVLGSNAYVWICLALLLATPIVRPAPALADDGIADFGQADVTATRRPERGRPVRV
ncbi:glycosyltransferase 87 family protein [Allocatelliglobosispora scoriae]|uniref:glycosyltransferase 87 family protein n=1 Tax=Allocatelliglobosispora scoriae TaxID=643052 RepID=UPI0035E41A55